MTMENMAQRKDIFCLGIHIFSLYFHVSVIRLMTFYKIDETKELYLTSPCLQMLTRQIIWLFNFEKYLNVKNM